MGLESQQYIEARFQLAYPATSSQQFSLDVDLVLPGQGITAVFGQSGSGKTTFLRCVAGLQKVKNSRLIINGDTWQNEKAFLPTHKRPLGYVFQESSLFPHLTAQGNLAYATKRADSPASSTFYNHVISLMGIESILKQMPEQLSGGERQRVAIARALLINPRLLLMDEPLASLDVARKQEILPYLEKLHEAFDIPVLYVSHSVDEVARLADYLVVMDQGQAVTHGTLTDVLSRTDLPIQLGEDVGVVLEASIVERDEHWHLVKAEFPGGGLWLRDNGDTIGQSIRIRILARDVSLTLKTYEDTSILNRLPAEIIEIAPDTDEAMALVQLQIGNSIVIARVTRRSVMHLQLDKGSNIWAQIKSGAIVS